MTNEEKLWHQRNVRIGGQQPPPAAYVHGVYCREYPYPHSPQRCSVFTNEELKAQGKIPLNADPY